MRFILWRKHPEKADDSDVASVAMVTNDASSSTTSCNTTMNDEESDTVDEYADDYDGDDDDYMKPPGIIPC